MGSVGRSHGAASVGGDEETGRRLSGVGSAWEVEVVKVCSIGVDCFPEGGREKAQGAGVVVAPRSLSMFKLVHVADGFGDVVIIVADGDVPFSTALVELFQLASPVA